MDGPGRGVAVWSSAVWRELAVAWLDERLADAGLARTGEVEQPRVRPWATLLTAPTTGGRVWLKAGGPSAAFEAGLYEVLHRTAPARVLPPVAVDAARGWVLLPDGGRALGDRLDGGELVDALAVALAQYGRLQRELARCVDEMLALGVPDMRPPVMPERFEEALRAAGEYVERRGAAEDREALRRLGALRPVVARRCRRLAAAPGAASVDHNDLHPWNILLADPEPAPDHGIQARFYDWGDSVVAHPFASMFVALSTLPARVLEVPAAPPVIRRLRDAYLEPFADLAPPAELVEALELACWVTKIARALTWTRVVRSLDPEEVDETWERAPLRFLAAMLDDG